MKVELARTWVAQDGTANVHLEGIENGERIIRDFNFTRRTLDDVLIKMTQLAMDVRTAELGRGG